MKNPFAALLKASRRARRVRSSAVRILRRLVPAATPKRKKAGAKSATRRSVSKQTRRPAPGSFVNGNFVGPHGSLDYMLYTPLGSARRRLPLVVMLHGCSQSAADFATGTGMNALADVLGFLVLYPQQSVSANIGRCWNWHRPGDQERGRGEPAVVAALTLQIIENCKANPARVYIAGISAGGAAAAIIAAAYSDLYAAVGVHSGLARGTVSTLGAALSAMRNGPSGESGGTTKHPLPTIIFHGDQDRVVHPSNATGFSTHLLRSSHRSIVSLTEKGRSIGGRDFTRTVYRQGLGEVLLDDWTVHGSGHAWSGGRAAGSHTDPAGPDASRAMARFFLARKRPATRPRSRQAESASRRTISRLP